MAVKTNAIPTLFWCCIFLVCLNFKTSFAQKRDTVTLKNITQTPAMQSTVAFAGYEPIGTSRALLPPNVAFMEQYGNVPINYSTGRLNYSLPLHTVEIDNSVSVPI